MRTYVPTKAEAMSQQGTSDDPPPPPAVIQIPDEEAQMEWEEHIQEQVEEFIKQAINQQKEELAEANYAGMRHERGPSV